MIPVTRSASIVYKHINSMTFKFSTKSNAKEDVRMCRICKETISVSKTGQDVKNAISKKQTRDDLVKVLGKCHLLRPNREQINEGCEKYEIIDQHARIILGAGIAKNVVKYDAETAETQADILHRSGEKPKDGTCDLTGDGGQLAFKTLEKIGDNSLYTNVVDLGGQDSSFIERFPGNVRSFVLDKNTLSPLIDKDETPKYMIGDAIGYLNSSSITSEKNAGKTAYAMNNFLNVLPPEIGWVMVREVVNQMSSGDTLTITSLHESQLKPPFFTKKQNLDGVVEFVLQNGKFYKCGLTEDFGENVLKKFPETKKLAEEDNTLTLMKDGKNVGTTKFKTLVFEKQ